MGKPIGAVKLSADFWLHEFLRSETAARRDIDMTPPDEVVLELQRLCEQVLQPLRTYLDSTIIITSGYRPPALNQIIGGSKRSAHMDGRAADCHAVGKPLSSIVAALRILDPPVDQAILEFGHWLHVAVSVSGVTPARNYMTAARQGGQTIYSTGINYA